MKSGSDVTVGETVEPGASVSSRGNVTVGRGIVGRKAQVVAQSSICAQHVQEATLTAGEDINIGSFAYHARMQAAGKVAIARKAGDDTNRSGSIMGGQTWGRKGIETHVAGTMNGMPSILVAGLIPEQAKEIDRLQRSIATSNSQIERILDRFELPMIDLTQIKNLIKAASGANRKLLARRARQFGERAQNHQKLLASRAMMKAQLGDDGNAEIKVWDRAFPGVVVRLGEHSRDVVEERDALRFHVEEDRLLER